MKKIVLVFLSCFLFLVLSGCSKDSIVGIYTPESPPTEGYSLPTSTMVISDDGTYGDWAPYMDGTSNPKTYSYTVKNDVITMSGIPFYFEYKNRTLTLIDYTNKNTVVVYKKTEGSK